MGSLATRYSDGPILRDVSELNLGDPAGETVLHLANARVALADYQLLQHDFVDLRPENLLHRHPRLQRLSETARGSAVHTIIDDWLLSNAAFISSAQVQQTTVNNEIPIDWQTTRGYRPHGYGRAFVVPVEHPTRLGKEEYNDLTISPGLLDLKGAGVAPGRVPSNAPASNGLEPLWCALRDHLTQRAIDAIFARELPTLWTVPTYAILDLGFELRGPQMGRGVPAGMHVRRAHWRATPWSTTSAVERQVRLDIELLLRRYGLTSANQGGWIEIYESDGCVVKRTGGERIEKLSIETIAACLAIKGLADYVKLEQFDIQISGEASWPPPTGHIVDFGTIHVRKAFDLPLCREAVVTLRSVDWPGNANFVSPDAQVALSIEQWQPNKVAAICSKLAWLFNRNELSQDELRQRLEEPLHRLAQQWAAAGATATGRH